TPLEQADARARDGRRALQAGPRMKTSATRRARARRVAAALLLAWPPAAWAAARALVVAPGGARADAVAVLAGSSVYVERVRRARWTFERVFEGSGVAVSFEAVPPGDETPPPLTWWLHAEGWRVVAGEYLKMGYYLARLG